jgi:biliverdin reductase/flavin reductase
LVKQGLARGHQVSAFVRNPTKLAEFDSNQNFKVIICPFEKFFRENELVFFFFKVVKCNLLNAEEVGTHLQGFDCVLSALGVTGIQIFKISFYLDSMKSIVAAMRKANVNRLLCVTSFYSKRKSI